MEQNKEPFAAENSSYVEAVTNMLLDYYKKDDSYDSVFAAVSDAQDAVEEFTSYAANHTIPECVCYLSDHYNNQLPLSSVVANTSTTTDNNPYFTTYSYWPLTYPYFCQCGGCLAYGTLACPRTNNTFNIVYTGFCPQKKKKDNKDNKNKNKKNSNNTKNKNNRSASAAETPSNRGKIDQFKAVANALASQYARKNEAYGDSFGKSVRHYGVISALTRMSDKWNRLESLLIDGNKNGVKDENVDDTLLDLATYCIMTVLGTRNNDELNKIVAKLEGK